MRSHGNSNEKGIILVSVLWVVVLLSLVVTSFNAAVRTNINVTRTELDLAKLETIATAGIELAIARLHAEQGARWSADGRAYSLSFAGAKLKIRIFDANGRVDVNVARSETLRAVLPFVTGSQSLGQNLHDFIIAKRVSVAQAERADGRTLQKSTSETNKIPEKPTFRDIAQLLDAPGISPRILARLRRHLTVHSNGTGLNLMTAPVDLVPVLPDLTGLQVADILRARAQGNDDAGPSLATPSSGRGFTDQQGPAYRIVVEVNDGGFAKPITASATIMIDEDDHLPYLALSWQSFGS